MCSVGINCCLECHMAWEEKHAARFLPTSLQRRLRHEHRELAAAGFPPDALKAHTIWEEAAFRRYCPGGMAHQIAVDHAAGESGQLRSRKT